MFKNRYIAAMRHAGSVIALTAVMNPNVSLAADVTLKSSDGSINITGEFLRFQDNIYTLRTAVGDVNVAGARVSCEGAICPAIEIKDAEFTLTGSRDLGEALAPLLLEGFARNLTAALTLTSTNQANETFAVLTADGGYGARVGSYLIQSSDTQDGLSRLAQSSTHLAMTGRRIRPEEARKLNTSGAGDMNDPQQEHIVAVDSLVVILHPDNPVGTISYDQLRNIYLGKITNWSELGGDDLAISAVTLPQGNTLREVFDRAVLNTNDAIQISKSVILDDMIEVADHVNNTTGAIGFVGYSFQRGAKPATLINACGIAERPDAFSARTEEYALQRRVYLYSRSDAAPDSLRDFLSFATSPKADSMVAKAGFIGFGIERLEQDLNGERATALRDVQDRYERQFADQALAQIDDFDRLSTTFRFRTGSSQLEERGQLDLQRLVDHLADLPTASEVKFVGFTDDVGSFQGNLTLSENRASQVLDQIKALAGNDLPNVSMTSVGYSELAATGCNLDDNGRRINRRVEVWIKPAL